MTTTQADGPARQALVRRAERARTWYTQGVQVVTFFVAGAHFGIEVLRVQEIIRALPTTHVPLADDTVRGLLNLRGQIVTSIDLRKRLEFPPAADGAEHMNLIVNSEDGPVSLAFDAIGEVINVPAGVMEDPPANLDASRAGFLAGVCKLETGLLLLLDVDQVIAA